MRTYFAQATVATAVVLAMTTQAYAQNFRVVDYEFFGLNRVTPDSLTTLLPNTGAVMTDEILAQTVRSLYETEQFSDVQVYVQNGVVRYQFKERPVIAEVNFEGNRLIPKQALEEGLKQAGLASGMVLKQDTLHAIANDLQNQYIMQGYYNSDVQVKQTELEGNRVKLDIEFTEGKPARVVDVNIIGNNYFDDEEIKSELSLKVRGWNVLSRADRYAQEKLTASLEALTAKYKNAGFVRFEIENSSLNISDDKNSVFLEIAVNEGEQYRFGETRFLGDVHYAQDDLKKAIAYQSNTQFSQAQVDKTTQELVSKFGNDGYYNAHIRPIPRINDQTRTVDVEYYIDPARPVYVRRINFSGNIKTKDEVLRREMRQLEGALASAEKIQLSRARLMRTGYFKNATVETKPVAGSPDQIDVNFVVEEQPSGSSTIAAGYSQSGGVTFQVDLSQNNFMGTGNKVNAAFSRSETRDNYSLGYTDPYFTVNGISQSLGAYYRKTKYDSKNISNYVLDSFGGNLSYGYPIDENQRISGGINLDRTKVRGGRFMGISNVHQLIEDKGKANYADDIASFENDYSTSNLLLGWSYSSLDKPVFPTKGVSHSIDLTLGFGDATYQKVVYNGNYYQPLIKGSTLRGYTRLGYGNDLPFYENFYAGGYGSVRGYEPSSLGPQSQAYQYLASGLTDANGTPLASGKSAIRGEVVGGNAMATFGAELILPMPFKGDWTEQVRPVVFVEGGQVFETSDLTTKKIDLATINPELASLSDDKRYAKLLHKDEDLRYSAGVGATWYTPIGPISISYAKPFGNKKGDRTDNVQFQIGSVF